jgi:putative restriction endonuclease
MPALESRQLATIEVAIEALYRLHVGVVGEGSLRHERPHKPCLLLAVLDLLATGQATPDRIPWNQSLRDLFKAYFDIVRTPQDQCNPNLPFWHLKSEQWWQPIRSSGSGSHPLTAAPTAADAKSGTVHASLVEGMERFTGSPLDRMILRNALVSRYFPRARPFLLPLFAEPHASLAAPPESPQAPSRVEEEALPNLPGRHSGFRRKILDLYDCQCAACGLRIRLPQTDDLTFVDAAHLIPFSSSFNDHPTNGIALCKNHHWAMDRYLIAPAPNLSWIVSPRLDERRSDGEKSLVALKGKRVLPPAEPAFSPDRDALQWRVDRLLA